MNSDSRNKVGESGDICLEQLLDDATENNKKYEDIIRDLKREITFNKFEKEDVSMGIGWWGYLVIEERS